MNAAPFATPLLLAALLATSGCCGGYAVVSTTMHDRAEVRQAGELAPGEATVLHYSRMGEPQNNCGSGAKFTEDLWIQVPSVQPGSAHTLGAPGVVATYVRDQEGNPVRATAIAGKVTVKERSGKSMAVVLDVTINLPSGEAVRLDDEYAFHPRPSPR